MRSEEYIKELKKKHQSMEKCPTCDHRPNLIFNPDGIFHRVHCYNCGTRLYDTDSQGPFVMINKWDKEVIEIKLNTKHEVDEPVTTQASLFDYDKADEI